MYALLKFEETFKLEESNFFVFTVEILRNFYNIEFPGKINIWKAIIYAPISKKKLWIKAIFSILRDFYNTEFESTCQFRRNLEGTSSDWRDIAK